MHGMHVLYLSIELACACALQGTAFLAVDRSAGVVTLRLPWLAVLGETRRGRGHAKPSLYLARLVDSGRAIWPYGK